ncbi:MAG: hypothetical protein M4579_001802 [Chaenotheca gracillima]|nr:MAG: hypothetical protein M4579_001802 [Chaenotheca gracillima]
MSLSDSSPLSSPPSSEDEEPVLQFSKKDGKLNFASKKSSETPATTTEVSPSQKKRAPSPPHEYVLADDPDIAFIVMFRSRFADAFPKSLAHYGPQDIEQGVVDSVPGVQVENLLCAILGLVLNRKKYVERGHYQRALEEALQVNTPHWPRKWGGKNPLHGGKSFASMGPKERLELLKTLILWALSSSEAIQQILKDSYKQARHDDDLNQPLSIQPWGTDGDRRRYWLIEGQDDTHFRLYRESAARLKSNTWWSVAGSIEDLHRVAQQLQEEGSQAARRLSERISTAIPRFEATEEKRKRREYRLARRQQFTRPEPGFSLYEGRTRGKKMKYTYSSDEDGSDDASTRRSTRQSGVSTPRDEGPTVTASGRQVRSRYGGAYGETVTGNQKESSSEPVGEELDEIGDNSIASNSRPRRSGLREEVTSEDQGGDHQSTFNSVDEMEDEEEAASSGGDEYPGDGDDDEDEEDNAMDDAVDEDEDLSNAEIDTKSAIDEEDSSLVVRLRYGNKPDEVLQNKTVAPREGLETMCAMPQAPEDPEERIETQKTPLLGEETRPLVLQNGQGESKRPGIESDGGLAGVKSPPNGVQPSAQDQTPTTNGL